MSNEAAEHGLWPSHAYQFCPACDLPPTPDPDCRYCGGSGVVVGGDEVRDCYCRGLVATDLTADNSALRGQRDALRHEDAEMALD